MKLRILIPPHCAFHQAGSSILFGDELFDRLSYIQILDDVLTGIMPLKEEETVVQLAAFAIAIDHGGYSKCNCQNEDPEESTDCIAFSIAIKSLSMM